MSHDVFWGNASKFTIWRDPQTGFYLSLVNRVTGSNDSQRNVLSLVSSHDYHNANHITLHRIEGWRDEAG